MILRGGLGPSRVIRSTYAHEIPFGSGFAYLGWCPFPFLHSLDFERKWKMGRGHLHYITPLMFLSYDEWKKGLEHRTLSTRCISGGEVIFVPTQYSVLGVHSVRERGCEPPCTVYVEWATTNYYQCYSYGRLLPKTRHHEIRVFVPSRIMIIVTYLKYYQLPYREAWDWAKRPLLPYTARTSVHGRLLFSFDPKHHLHRSALRTTTILVVHHRDRSWSRTSWPQLLTIPQFPACPPRFTPHSSKLCR